MQTEKEIKINVLTEELENAQSEIEKEKAAFEALVKETTKNEISKIEWDEDLVELKDKAEIIKNSIPDFNEKTCALYVEYYKAKDEYKKNCDIYESINEKMKKKEEKLNISKDLIKFYTERINNIKEKLEKLKSK